MYEEFYKLKEKPFDLNPSPRFLYLSDTHKEALALLTYGVMERKGFVLLTGEVGTGKTTIVQALIASLDKSIQYIFVSNPLMPTQDFLDYIAFNTFHKKIHFKSKSDFLIEFEEYLKKCRQHQKTFVLIIDESQTLSYDLLEEIRLLSNMESADEKLINIFLIGQPELNDKLSESRCRPILQRINNRYHLKPLDLNNTRTYVSTRLKVAGIENSGDLFPGKTIKALHEYSEGYPRMINVLADNALLLGYSQEKKKITPAMIRECYEDINVKSSKSARQSKTPEILLPEQPKNLSRERSWRWGFTLLLFVLLILLGLNYWQNETDYPPQKQQLDKNTNAPPEVSSVKAPESKKDELVKVEPSFVNHIKEKITVPLENEPAKNNTTIKIIENREEQGAVDNVSPLLKIKEKPSTLIKVKRGDTVSSLAIDIYGRVDVEILDMIKQQNPNLYDIDYISIGQEILFPALPSKDGEAHYTVQVGSFKDFKNAQEQFQRLIQSGNEAYILPIADEEQAFRVTLGLFPTRPEAELFALSLLIKNVSKELEVIKININ